MVINFPGQCNLDAVASIYWDVLIIGTGMGGAVLGYHLAKAGKRVLFLERGKTYRYNANAVMGTYAECVQNPIATGSDILRDSGRCWQEIIDASSGNQNHAFIPFIGAGSGGSTALYGMALDRLLPQDFAPRQNYQCSLTSTLPETWPIAYEQLLPYYRIAEELFRVRGDRDPRHCDHRDSSLLPATPLTAAGREFFDFLASKGMHPYRLPIACESAPGCQTCTGFICSKNCKNDAVKICLTPAVETYGASLLDECEVTKLEATRSQVTSVICNRRGQTLKLHASDIVLAAGALQTPRILLMSKSALWPEGLANDSRLVGRNLMRHYLDIYAIFLKNGNQTHGTKELVFNDFYIWGNKKFGSVQAFGTFPAAEACMAELQCRWNTGSFKHAASLGNLFCAPILKAFINGVQARSVLYASILEDLPYSENRISVGEEGKLVINYQIREEEQRRINEFRLLMKKILTPYRFLLFRAAETNTRLAHACGTCRFGNDPKTSVLNALNRAHGLSNLYIVDSSFFPSSGGTGPALTIAANAIRVADYMLKGEVNLRLPSALERQSTSCT
jgi:choline dehydrogenase-like flavoprotein